MSLNKLLTLITLIAITLSFNINSLSNRITDTFSNGYQKIVTKFGDVTYLKKHSEDVEEVLLTQSGTWEDPNSYKAALDTILDLTQNPQRKQQFIQCSKGKKGQEMKFASIEVGVIGNKAWDQSIILERREDDCFQKVIVSFHNLKKDAINTIEIEMWAQGRRGTCSQAYMFGTGAKVHVHNLILKKHHKFTWKNMNEVQYDNVITYGIHIFRHCDTIAHLLPDVLKTAQLFVGGLGKNPNIPFFGAKPPKYMERLNLDFIEAGTGYRWKVRVQPKFVNLSQYEVRQGDFLAITRFDGLDQIIQYGSGSRAGHSAMVIKVDGVMSVIESTDGWYWPKRGIQRNDWETWKKWANNANFNVAVLPLNAQSKKNFNTTKAVEFFKKYEGQPYGYHNFLFGWIDTPTDNYPPVLDVNYVLVAFSLLERIYQYPIKRIFTEALNKRLGTQKLKFSQITVEMAKRGLTFGELMSIPERDGWKYSDGYSFVCGAFVAAVYQAGGLLNEIQGTQFTPKDVYTLNIFDRNWKVPKKCSDNDPSLPYCQIMGKYTMQLPGYATIEPYPHMAERCPTLTPQFYRPDGC